MGLVLRRVPHIFLDIHVYNIYPCVRGISSSIVLIVSGGACFTCPITRVENVKASKALDR